MGKDCSSKDFGVRVVGPWMPDLSAAMISQSSKDYQCGFVPKKNMMSSLCLLRVPP